ncbi:MAG: hypothetical protein ABR565_09230 [Gammaproteobacteria bacterium]
MTDTAFTIPAFMLALPEIWLLTAACAVLLADLFIPDARRALTLWLSVAVILVTAGLVVIGFPDASTTTFEGMFIHDPMSAVLKVGMLVIAAFALLCSRAYLADRGLLKGEYFTLALFSVLGLGLFPGLLLGLCAAVFL